MIIARWAAALASLTLIAPSEADACQTIAPRVLDDVLVADVVIIGRILEYRWVLGQEHGSYCKINGVRSKLKCLKQRYMTDYHRLTLAVDEVLVGSPPKTLTVTWDGGPEHMADGPYLIALQRAAGKRLPLRGPSATLFPTPEPNLLTVLGAPCAPSFVIEQTSPDVAVIRKILRTK